MGAGRLEGRGHGTRGGGQRYFAYGCVLSVRAARQESITGPSSVEAFVSLPASSPSQPQIKHRNKSTTEQVTGLRALCRSGLFLA